MHPPLLSNARNTTSIGQTVTDAPTDKEQLVPTLASIPAELGKPDTVLTDSGFYSEAAVGAVEAPGPDGLPETQVLAAVVRKGHHRSVADLEKRDDPPPPGPQATAREHMIHRTATGAGKTLYKQRQQTVEPVFGIIKSAMGFRQFVSVKPSPIEISVTIRAVGIIYGSYA